MLFTFPKDIRQNAERSRSEYSGVVQVPRRVFRRLLSERPTPQRCVEAYNLQRTRCERISKWSCVCGPLSEPVIQPKRFTDCADAKRRATFSYYNRQSHLEGPASVSFIDERS